MRDYAKEKLEDLFVFLVCLVNKEGINLQETWDKMMKEKHYG